MNFEAGNLFHRGFLTCWTFTTLEGTKSSAILPRGQSDREHLTPLTDRQTQTQTDTDPSSDTGGSSA